MTSIARILLFSVCLLTVAVVAAGCAGSDDDGIATAGTTAQTASNAPAADPVARARQYVACLREHHIDVPDPDPATGAVRVPRPSEQPGVRDAMSACRKYAPEDAGGADEQAAAMARA